MAQWLPGRGPQEPPFAPPGRPPISDTYLASQLRSASGTFVPEEPERKAWDSAPRLESDGNGLWPREEARRGGGGERHPPNRKVLPHLEEKASGAAAGAAAPLPLRVPPPLPASLSSSAIPTPSAPSLPSLPAFPLFPRRLVRRAPPRALTPPGPPINKRGALENNRGASLQRPIRQRNCARDPAAILRPERGRPSLRQPRVAAVRKKPGSWQSLRISGARGPRGGRGAKAGFGGLPCFS